MSSDSEKNTSQEEDAFAAQCDLLGQIASGYPDDSSERAAIFVAAQALHFVRREETVARFRAWVASWDQPPTALQVLHAKLCGIDDLPHSLLDETMREIEQLMDRLQKIRS